MKTKIVVNFELIHGLMLAGRNLLFANKEYTRTMSALSNDTQSKTQGVYIPAFLDPVGHLQLLLIPLSAWYTTALGTIA